MRHVSSNPYAAPAEEPGPGPSPQARARFKQAAIVAWLASAYWALMTALIALGVAAGAASGSALVLPAALIALYAYRGYQVFHCNLAAATGLLILHVVGGAVAVFQLSTGDSLLVTLTGIKVAIHVLGCITAARARSAPAPVYGPQ